MASLLAKSVPFIERMMTADLHLLRYWLALVRLGCAGLDNTYQHAKPPILATILLSSARSQFICVGAMKKSAWRQSRVYCSRPSATFSNGSRSPQTATE
jgi:hypothetical protein